MAVSELEQRQRRLQQARSSLERRQEQLEQREKQARRAREQAQKAQQQLTSQQTLRSLKGIGGQRTVKRQLSGARQQQQRAGQALDVLQPAQQEIEKRQQRLGSAIRTISAFREARKATEDKIPFDFLSGRAREFAKQMRLQQSATSLPSQQRRAIERAEKVAGQTLTPQVRRQIAEKVEEGASRINIPEKSFSQLMSIPRRETITTNQNTRLTDPRISQVLTDTEKGGRSPRKLQSFPEAPTIMREVPPPRTLSERIDREVTRFSLRTAEGKGSMLDKALVFGANVGGTIVSDIASLQGHEPDIPPKTILPKLFDPLEITSLRGTPNKTIPSPESFSDINISESLSDMLFQAKQETKSFGKHAESNPSAAGGKIIGTILPFIPQSKLTKLPKAIKARRLASQAKSPKIRVFGTIDEGMGGQKQASIIGEGQLGKTRLGALQRLNLVDEGRGSVGRELLFSERGGKTQLTARDIASGIGRGKFRDPRIVKTTPENPLIIQLEKRTGGQPFQGTGIARETGTTTLITGDLRNFLRTTSPEDLAKHLSQAPIERASQSKLIPTTFQRQTAGAGREAISAGTAEEIVSGVPASNIRAGQFLGVRSQPSFIRSVTQTPEFNIIRQTPTRGQVTSFFGGRPNLRVRGSRATATINPNVRGSIITRGARTGKSGRTTIRLKQDQLKDLPLGTLQQGIQQKAREALPSEIARSAQRIEQVRGVTAPVLLTGRAGNVLQPQTQSVTTTERAPTQQQPQTQSVTTTERAPTQQQPQTQPDVFGIVPQQVQQKTTIEQQRQTRVPRARQAQKQKGLPKARQRTTPVQTPAQTDLFLHKEAIASGSSFRVPRLRRGESVTARPPISPIPPVRPTARPPNIRIKPDRAAPQRRQGEKIKGLVGGFTGQVKRGRRFFSTAQNSTQKKVEQKLVKQLDRLPAFEGRILKNGKTVPFKNIPKGFSRSNRNPAWIVENKNKRRDSPLEKAVLGKTRRKRRK